MKFEEGSLTWTIYLKVVSKIKKNNEQFERYYNELGIVPEGEEREAFWAALRRELPNSFRFCGSKGYTFDLTDTFGSVAN